jgi:hypothetical protein
MNIRQAILLAADSIEQNPKMFNYASCYRPDFDCGTPGCALGWIGLHAGIAVNADGGRQGKFVKTLDAVADLTTGDNHACTFYERMSAISSGWKCDAADCAAALRKYADKYHPEEFKRFHQALIPADSGYNWREKVTV